MPLRYTVKKGPIARAEAGQILGTCCVNTSVGRIRDQRLRRRRNPATFPCKACDFCEALTANGSLCRNRTCKFSDFCWIHLKKKYGLRVKTSTIPNAGLGLFTDARKTFARDDKIGPAISGEIMSSQQLDDRYDYFIQPARGRRRNVDPSDPYGLPFNGYVISADCIRNAGSYANDPLNRRRINARFSQNLETAEIHLVATKRIRSNSEIFVNYGVEYFRGLWGRYFRRRLRAGDPPQFLSFQTKQVKGTARRHRGGPRGRWVSLR